MRSTYTFKITNMSRVTQLYKPGKDIHSYYAMKLITRNIKKVESFLATQKSGIAHMSAYDEYKLASMQ